MGVERLTAFTDGVIAIIITIMVLELKVPQDTSWDALRPLAQTFFAYALSFTYVAIYWNNHHHLLHAARFVTGAILWANTLLLFWLSIVPFFNGLAQRHTLRASPDRLLRPDAARARDRLFRAHAHPAPLRGAGAQGGGSYRKGLEGLDLFSALHRGDLDEPRPPLRRHRALRARRADVVHPPSPHRARARTPSRLIPAWIGGREPRSHSASAASTRAQLRAPL